MVRIGYQGDIGSNSEEAAKNIAKTLGLTDVEFVPLINSKRVIEELKAKNIDYGVVASLNSTTGVVEETAKALRKQKYSVKATAMLPIHHCLFKRKYVRTKDLKVIASHIQALNQTKINREKYYPFCKEIAVEDTALAAKQLSEGNLSNEIAVICRKNAGEMYGLELVRENLEDDNFNYTIFVCITF